MLLRFRVKNYRSFRDEQELSLVASKLQDGESTYRVEAVPDGVLCAAGTYGANASGKSNVIKAFAYMKRAVENSQRNWNPEEAINVDPFRLDSDARGEPSTFEVDLLLNGVRFEYGFTLDSSRVVSEWLYAYPSARRQLWFLRTGDAEGQEVKIGKHLQGENRAIQNLMRRNSLFLSAAAQNNHDQLTPIYRWFSNSTRVLGLDETMGFYLNSSTAEICRQDLYRDWMTQFLAAADLGIVGFDVAERIDDPKLANLRTKFFDLLAEDMPNFSPPAAKDFPPTIRLRHRAKELSEGVPFESEDESAGTLAWLNLSGPISHALTTGATVFADELDASLHPLLAVELVKVFNDFDINVNHAQLIFNTHDTNLLESANLRRDQIWFVEKDIEGASHLYPLTDFTPRKSENLERGYLQGRYGAIPFLSLSDSLLRREPSSK